MTKILLYIVVLALSIASCSAQSSSISYKAGKVTFDIPEEINPNEILNFQYFINNDDEEFIICSDYELNYILKLSMTSFGLENKIDLKEISKKYGKFDAFHYINKDSIFLHLNEKLEFILINEGGELVEYYKVPTNFVGDSIRLMSYLMYESPLLFEDNKLIMFTGKYGETKYYSENCIGIFDINSKDFKWLISFPEEYSKHNIYLEFYPSYSISKNGTLLVSFSANEDIFEYSFDGKMINKKLVKSKYFDIDFQKLEYDKKMGLYEYRTPLDYYFALKNDIHSQFGIRIAFHGIELTNSDGSPNEFWDRPFSIIIFDTNYNYLDEIYIDNMPSASDFRFFARDKLYFVNKSCLEQKGELSLRYLEIVERGK